MIIPAANRLQHLKEYYFSVKLQEIRRMQEAGHHVINMGIGSPDLMPSEDTISALCESAKSADSHGYQPYKGLPVLRRAIADWYFNTYGVVMNPETEVLPLMGSKEGITHISLAFLNPGDEVLVPELGYPAYSAVTQMVEAKVRYYPLQEENNWQPDLDFLKAEYPGREPRSQKKLNKVKLMWLNYPHMPTGAAPDPGVMQQLVNFAHENKILLCHDNPYSLVLNSTKPFSLLSLPGAREVAIELNSLSKSHNMAGWRVGWVMGQKAYLDEIIKVKSNVDSGMFKPVQEAAIQALNNSEAWHSARNKIYQARRNIVFRMMDALGCTYNPRQQGLFVWAKVPASVTSVEQWVDDILQQHHVFITPGFIFGEKGQSYIRISLCNKEHILEEALRRLSKSDFL